MSISVEKIKQQCNGACWAIFEMQEFVSEEKPSQSELTAYLEQLYTKFDNTRDILKGFKDVD